MHEHSKIHGDGYQAVVAAEYIGAHAEGGEQMMSTRLEQLRIAN